MESKDFRKMSLRERLNQFPPFVCVALSHVRNERQTYQQNMDRLWSVKARKRRWSRILKGKEPIKRPPWRRMTHHEIAAKCGHKITARTVHNMAGYLNWNRFSVPTMLALTEACGVSFLHISAYHKRFRYHLKTGRMFTHLTPLQRKNFLKCLKKWKALKASSVAGLPPQSD